MSVYTKTGDKGTTSDLSGKRISKNDPRIHLVGALDELSAHLGLVKAMLADDGDKKFIDTVQGKLMKLMAHSSDAANEKYFFGEEEVAEVEREIDKLQEGLPKQMAFVLPGRNETEAQIHIARTVARRAERQYCAVDEEMQATTPLNPLAGVYMNRLSDYLFTLSRKN